MEQLKLRRHQSTALEQVDLRQPWAVDVDRILHSMAYTRYIDKTQVFYLLKNAHISHRVIHVQLVSRIARSIGLELGLNPDLLEAISLGHDLGHPPFGHDGEKFLSEICQEKGLGRFVHATMSVRFLERLEKGGRGLNLTLGVLDGILCHDGESDFTNLIPEGAHTFEELDHRLKIRNSDPLAHINPMSREGCVVRLADTISYVGRDLEDAIEIGLIERGQLPENSTNTLGPTNGRIVYTLVEDLIKNSQGDGPVAFSPTVAEALTALKNFNRQYIYSNPTVKTETHKIKNLYRFLFETLTADFKKGPHLEPSRRFLEHLDPLYHQEHNPMEMARDFIASMTDESFFRLAKELILPKWNMEHF